MLFLSAAVVWVSGELLALVQHNMAIGIVCLADNSPLSNSVNY